MNTLKKSAAKARCAASVLGVLLLGGCGLPAYIVKSDATIPIEVRGNYGTGFIMIHKLDDNCQPEARFENAISTNPRHI